MLCDIDKSSLSLRRHLEDLTASPAYFEPTMSLSGFGRPSPRGSGDNPRGGTLSARATPFVPRGVASRARGHTYTPRGASRGLFSNLSRGSGPATPFRTAATRDDSPGRDILEGLVSKPLKTLYRSGATAEAAEFRDLRYLASYNRLDYNQPTIAVPGMYHA